MDSPELDVLNAVSEFQQAQSLKIIELSESIWPEIAQNEQKRNSGISDVSAEGFENATPASLEADLVHYKELFSKLRFSYVEQVTKEKFLRQITTDPAPVFEPQENVELEAQLVETKAALKAQKVEVADMIAELERRGRDLSQRYQSVQLHTTEISSLPDKITSLESTISELRATQAPHPKHPDLSLPLPETLSLLSKREAELEALNSQLATLQAALPRKRQELERLENELKPLEKQKNATIAAAKDARRRREEGFAGMGDELEERGRWYRAVEAGLKGMLEVEG